jgi:hypothetical protein
LIRRRNAVLLAKLTERPSLIHQHETSINNKDYCPISLVIHSVRYL